MLRGPMPSARSERISAKRLAAAGDARPMSRALGAAAALLALGLALDLEALRAALARSFATAFAVAAGAEPGADSVRAALVAAGEAFAACAGPLLLALLAAVAAAGALQVLAPLGPRAVDVRRARFDVASRLRGLLAPERAIDAWVAAAMLLALGAVAWLTLAPNVRGALALPGAAPAVALPALAELARTLLVRLIAAGLALGALDYAQRRARLVLRLRMTTREQLEEAREQYGDPLVRAERLRRMRAGTEPKARQ